MLFCVLYDIIKNNENNKLANHVYFFEHDTHYGGKKMDKFMLSAFLHLTIAVMVSPQTAFLASIRHREGKNAEGTFWLILTILNLCLTCIISEYILAILFLIPSILSYIVGILWKNQWQWYHQRISVVIMIVVSFSLTIYYEIAIVYAFFNM